jgi:glycosyltransferase involved in cell wall biosynthesis
MEKKAPPRITIVTPSLNQREYIEESIQSILDQGYPNLEYMIFDGGSTDGSVELIRKYEKWLNFWTSHPDRGQAAAINSGLRRASGDIFNWVNTDDVMRPGTLSSVAAAFDGFDLVAGGVRNFGPTAEPGIVFNRGLDAIKMASLDPGVTYHQPGVWVRTEMLKSIGGIREQWRYYFDWEFTIRYTARYPRVKYLDRILMDYRVHPGSKTGAEIQHFEEERLAIIGTMLMEESIRSLHPHLRKSHNRMNWHRRVQQIRLQGGMTAFQKLRLLLSEILHNPFSRTDRFALGAVRRLLYQLGENLTRPGRET